MLRLALAGALAGTALLAPAASAAGDQQCYYSACYQCFMYPCGPDQWVEYLTGRTLDVCTDTVRICL